MTSPTSAGEQAWTKHKARNDFDHMAWLVVRMPGVAEGESLVRMDERIIDPRYWAARSEIQRRLP